MTRQSDEARLIQRYLMPAIKERLESEGVVPIQWIRNRYLISECAGHAKIGPADTKATEWIEVLLKKLKKPPYDQYSVRLVGVTGVIHGTEHELSMSDPITSVNQFLADNSEGWVMAYIDR